MHFDSAVPTDPEAIAAGGLLNWLSSTDKQFDVKSRIMQVRHWPVSTCGAAQYVPLVPSRMCVLRSELS